MNASGWFGIPYLVWAAICMLIALVWVFVWPREQAVNAAGIRFFLIRWGHALVWFLLAVNCLMKAGGNPTIAGWGNLVALASLFVYFGFLGASFLFR